MASRVGEPGRTLANGDLPCIEAVTRSGLIVRRVLDADPRTGQRRWTDRTFVYANYGQSELGYAVARAPLPVRPAQGAVLCRHHAVLAR